MTVSIIAPAGPGVEGRPLSLALDVPTLTSPPPAPRLALTATPHSHTPPVPLGVPAGPVDVEAALDDLVARVEDCRRILARLPAPGFLVTAADVQRAREVARLLAEVSAILAERA